MNDSTLPLKSGNKRRPRKKTGVQPGFGLHDWNRLLRSARDLAQRRGAPVRPIAASEIAKHDSVHDAWISLHGKVYNVTPYLHYHPGGVEIMEQCLGGDATRLFEKYHRWVNIQGLIGPLLIGVLEEEKKVDADEHSVSSRVIPPAMSQPKSHSTAPASSEGDEFAMPAPRPPRGATVTAAAATSCLLSSEASCGGEDGDDLNPWERN